MINLILAVLMGVSVECKEGMRDDPVMIIRANRNHYVYFMPDEMDLCKEYASKFSKRQIKSVCGCKILKDNNSRDRLRLRCAYWVDGSVLSRSVMWFYYYPELAESCKKVSRKLMRAF